MQVFFSSSSLHSILLIHSKHLGKFNWQSKALFTLFKCLVFKHFDTTDDVDEYLLFNCSIFLNNDW